MTEYPIPDHIEPKEFTLEQMKALSKTAASMRPVTYERALQEMIKRFETIEAERNALAVQCNLNNQGVDALMNSIDNTHRFQEEVAQLKAQNLQLLKVLAAARCVRHWHDTMRDGSGMVVSSEHVRALWAAIAEYDGIATRLAVIQSDANSDG